MVCVSMYVCFSSVPSKVAALSWNTAVDTRQVVTATLTCISYFPGLEEDDGYFSHSGIATYFVRLQLDCCFSVPGNTSHLKKEAPF